MLLLCLFGDDDVHDTCCPGIKRIEIWNAEVKTNVRAYKKIEESKEWWKNETHTHK